MHFRHALALYSSANTTLSLLRTLVMSAAPGTNTRFGQSIASSGNYVIIGASKVNTACIFDIATGALVHTLVDPNPYGTVASDQFGYSVAIDGNYAVVGAYLEDEATGTDSGKAYIYNVTTGALLWTLNNPNAYSSSALDWFGHNVAISGNYVVVGAYQEDDANGTYSGKAYVFNVTTGALAYTLNNPNPYGTSAGDQFGYSVAAAGNIAVISAAYESDASGVYSGKVYVFNLTTGALLYTLNNPNPYGTSAGDQFGAAVAIDGTTIVIGCQFEDESSEASGTDSGKVYVYDVTTGALVWTLNNPNAYGTVASDQFGAAVAISGNYCIVGASIEDTVGGVDGVSSGKAYIFNLTTGALAYTLNNPNPYGTGANDFFGSGVSISGNNIIVGAVGEDVDFGTDFGKAYIYSLP